MLNFNTTFDLDRRGFTPPYPTPDDILWAGVIGILEF